MAHSGKWTGSWKAGAALLFAALAIGCGGATVGTGLRYGGGSSASGAEFTLLTLQGSVQGPVPGRIEAKTSAGASSARPDGSGNFLLVTKRVGDEPVRLTLELNGDEIPVSIEGIPAGAKKWTVVLKGSAKSGYKAQAK